MKNTTKLLEMKKIKLNHFKIKIKTTIKIKDNWKY